jgi:integrase
MASIKKRGKVWYSDLRIGDDRIRRPLSRDRDAALQELGNLIKERMAIKSGGPLTDLTWPSFKIRYMAYSANKSPRTHDIDKLAFRKLEAAVPLKMLRDLNPDRLALFQESLHREGRALGTQNRLVRAIKAAINKAIEWGMLTLNPAYKKVKYYKEVTGKLEYLQTDEIKILLRGVRGVWLTVAMLGCYAGLRRREMYYLRAANIDYKLKRIHIEPTAEFTPKDCERRWIPLHPLLEIYLKKTVNGSEYVMGEKRPNPYMMTTRFGLCMKNLGLPGSLHTLRHTFASQAVMHGVPIATLSKWLGHANTRTTDIYTHLAPDHSDQAIRQIPAL